MTQNEADYAAGAESRQEEVDTLRKQLADSQRRERDRLTTLERLRGRMRVEPEIGYDSLARQLAAALNRLALESSRADMLHAALNALAQRPLWVLPNEHRHLLDEADDALRLSRTRRTGLFVECRSCGAMHSVDDWVRLPSVGLQEQAELPGDPLELRNCECGTTLALPLRRLPQVS